MEPNGQISILPKSLHRPVTPKDLNLKPADDAPIVNLIIDGEILYENLKLTGNDEKWLENQLKNQKVDNLSDVFLATCSSKNNLSIYLKTNKKITHDMFQ